jgi:hypothetical protein
MASPYNPYFTPGYGFAPFAQVQLDQQVGEGNAPLMKLDYMGLTQMLQGNKKVLENNGTNLQTYIVKYKKRWTVLETETSLSCTTSNEQAYDQVNVVLDNYRQLAVALDDTTVQQYELEASQTVALGLPPTPMMNETIREIYAGANGLLKAINQDLWALAIAGFGTNTYTGNTIDTINITQDTTLYPLTDGMTAIMNQYQQMLGTGTPRIVGNGLFNAFANDKRFKQPGLNGLDTSMQQNQAEWYLDQDATSLLGNNQVVVYQPDVIQMVEFMQFTGFYAGPRPGNSIFGTLALPLQMGSEIKDVQVDMQLIYSPCATEYTPAYSSGSINLVRGWNVILSKVFGLFTIPTNAYRPWDEQYGNVGEARYTITNS